MLPAHSTERKQAIRSLFATLTPDAVTVLDMLFNIFDDTVANSAVSKMAADNLAVCACNALV